MTATDLDDEGDETGAVVAAPVVDGRRARRERNRETVIDAVAAMFAEEMLVPSIEKAAERSGLSLRSVYRYFPDPEALLQATIDRAWEQAAPLAHLEAIGRGPFDTRLDAFVEMRTRLFDHIGPTYRATLHHEAGHPAIREDLQRVRRAFTEQFERHFTAELRAFGPAERERALAAGDLISQFEAFDRLRRYQRLTQIEAGAVVADALRTLLTAPR
jgi:AcrR family transcriptional regulator